MQNRPFLSRVFCLHGQLKNFVGNFKNVSTKHLNNYVVWLGWNVENRGMTVRATAESIFYVVQALHSIIPREWISG